MHAYIQTYIVTPFKPSVFSLEKDLKSLGKRRLESIRVTLIPCADKFSCGFNFASKDLKKFGEVILRVISE